MNSSSASPDDMEVLSSDQGLDEASIQQEMVLFFVNLFTSLGLPKSFGEIYGRLFCEASPLCFDEIVAKTGLSKGSASSGIRILQRFGAIQPIDVPADRRSFYVAEVRLRKLVGGFLRENIEPPLRRGEQHLSEIEAKFSSLGTEPSFLFQRLISLRAWNRQSVELLPWLIRMAGSDQP